MAIKKLPAADAGPQLQCLTRAGERYLVTENPTTRKFTLWKVVPEGYDKISTADSPVPLNSKIPW